MGYKEVCLPPKPEVLIVLGPGGTIDVYTNQRMRIHVATLLRGLPDTAAAEQLNEEYLKTRLPAWARELYEVGDRLVLDRIRLLKPSQEAERLLNVELVRHCTEDYRKAREARLRAKREVARVREIVEGKR